MFYIKNIVLITVLLYNIYIFQKEMVKLRYIALDGKEKFSIRTGDFCIKGTPLIKTTHVGICGTDISYWKEGDTYQNVIIGHEYSGIIEDPGNSTFQKGDRVVGHTQNNYKEPCGHCEQCLNQKPEQCTNKIVKTWKGGELSHPGAYSEYTTWFEHSILKLPDNVSNEEAALVEPFAVALHAVNISDIKPGDKVLILGGGIIGLAVSEWCKAFGACEITMTEVNEKKFDLIQSYGTINHVVNGLDPNLSDVLGEISDGGYDIMIDCAGVASAFQTGMEALKQEKKMRITGIALTHKPFPVDYHRMVFQEIIFKGSKGQTIDEFRQVLKALSEKKINVKKYISKKITLNEVQETFEAIRDNTIEPYSKILITF